jgi:hypothetical protein
MWAAEFFDETETAGLFVNGERRCDLNRHETNQAE